MSTLSRIPFVGVGTGRCGTTSLAEIVKACKNTFCTHEAYSFLWYEVDETVGKMIRDFREKSSKGVLVGDVGQSIISRLPEIRSSFRNLKVICLHRDKQSTIESFRRYGWPKIRPGDKRRFLEKCKNSTDQTFARSIRAWPIIDGITSDQACGFYWDMYEAMMDRIRDPVLHVMMEDLNDDATLSTIFEFLEIPEADRVFIDKRKFWTADDVEEIRKERKRASAW